MPSKPSEPEVSSISNERKHAAISSTMPLVLPVPGVKLDVVSSEGSQASGLEQHFCPTDTVFRLRAQRPMYISTEHRMERAMSQVSTKYHLDACVTDDITSGNS